MHLNGQVKAIGTTDNYVGSSAFIVRKGDTKRTFEIQIQGSGPSYNITVEFLNNKIISKLNGTVAYGIRGQVIAIL